MLQPSRDVSSPSASRDSKQPLTHRSLAAHREFARRFARRVYSREPTRRLEVAAIHGACAPQREPDAPVPIRRRRARRMPSAVDYAAYHIGAYDEMGYEATLAQPVWPGEVEPAHQVLRRELMLLFHEWIDDPEGIEIDIAGDVVTLRGRVSDSLARLLAEDLAYTRPEVRDCRNALEVGPRAPVMVA